MVIVQRSSRPVKRSMPFQISHPSGGVQLPHNYRLFFVGAGRRRAGQVWLFHRWFSGIRDNLEVWPTARWDAAARTTRRSVPSVVVSRRSAGIVLAAGPPARNSALCRAYAGEGRALVMRQAIRQAVQQRARLANAMCGLMWSHRANAKIAATHRAVRAFRR